MSDTIESLGQVFSTTVEPAGTTQDITPLLAASDVASAAPDMASAAPDMASGVPDTATTPPAPDAAPPPAESPASSASDPGAPQNEPPPQESNPAPTDARESGGSLALNNAGGATTPYSPTSTPENKGILNSAATWFSNLSEPAKAMLAGGAAGGAGQMLRALAQKHMLDYEREAEERHRQDMIRRGHVDAFSEGAFKPKGGIVDSARAPKAGRPTNGNIIGVRG